MWELSFYETLVCIISICVRYFQSVGWHCAVREKWMQQIIAKLSRIGSSSFSSSCPVIFEISSRNLNNFAFDFQKLFRKSKKLLPTSVFLNSNMGPSGLYTGLNFCQKLRSKVTKRAGFSNRSKELLVALFGNKLAMTLNLREETRPTCFWNFLFWSDQLLFGQGFSWWFFDRLLIVILYW